MSILMYKWKEIFPILETFSKIRYTMNGDRNVAKTFYESVSNYSSNKHFYNVFSQTDFTIANSLRENIIPEYIEMRQYEYTVYYVLMVI